MFLLCYNLRTQASIAVGGVYSVSYLLGNMYSAFGKFSKAKQHYTLALEILIEHKDLLMPIGLATPTKKISSKYIATLRTFALNLAKDTKHPPITTRH